MNHKRGYPRKKFGGKRLSDTVPEANRRVMRAQTARASHHLPGKRVFSCSTPERADSNRTTASLTPNWTQESGMQ